MPPHAQPRGRRALRNVGGQAVASGNESEGQRLAEILNAAQAGNGDGYTHGFHSYPARMHPAIARGVLATYAAAGDRVLDPFCGSGTVLVESLVAGMRARGVDLNPLGVRLSSVKCQVRDVADRERFSAMLAEVVEASKQRVRARSPTMAPLGAPERRFYEVHVLKELAGIYDILSEIAVGPNKAALQMLLTAIVVKFSKKRADTAPSGSTDVDRRRIGKYVPSEFYGRKGQELVRRWAELEAACTPSAWYRPKVVEGNATALVDVLPPRWSAHLVLTSPPYGGTYDYVRHHSLRYPWLGVSVKAFERLELGARRNLSADTSAAGRWDDEVAAMLGSMEGVLEDNGQIVLLMGDAEVGGRRVEVVPQLQRLGGPRGLRVVASASQARLDWQGGKPRREHLVLLRRT